MTLRWSNIFRSESSRRRLLHRPSLGPGINSGAEESEMNTWSLYLRILIFGLIMFSAVLPSIRQKILAPSAICSGQPNTSNNTPQAIPGGSGFGLLKRNWRYRIKPSDILELTFALTTEFNQTVNVRPDAYITLRGVGDLAPAGQTLPELTESIETPYSKILQDPEINDDPKEFEKPFFTAGGQVGKTGEFDWYGDITLTQAIAIAGGFTNASKHSQVLLFRRVSDQWTVAVRVENAWVTSIPQRPWSQMNSFQNISAEIIVVGAGLAGVTAAAVLGQQGRRVILVDPRPSCLPLFTSPPGVVLGM
jgi:protein involved in polysaccharide export with SLBB domain